MIVNQNTSGMKKNLLIVAAAIAVSASVHAQCTTTNAKTCVCPPGGGISCDLIPDIKVSVDALQSGYTVYTQTGNAASSSQGSNDGRLRLTGTTPNIGYGPLETRSINKWLCGTDTLLSNPGTLCPDGRVPKRFVVQRIYHKSDSVMSFTDIPCGTMTYHQSHGHMHIDNWGIYTLRIQNPNEPDPTKWSIVGTGTKLAFCLLDIGSCNNGSGIYCRDDNNNPLMTSQIPNNTIGNGSYSCSSTLQGISNGWYDTYSSSLDGMWIDIPPGTCNGNYYIVVQIDPNQNMTEMNENNNVIAVPVTLTNQAAAGNPVATISANNSGTIIPGQNVILTATAGTSYLWSPGGGTTQSITVNSAGTYTCTVTNYCGTATSSPFTVTVLPPAPVPTVTGATICSGSTANLSASNGGNGTLKWYNNTTSTIPLATGSSYTTPQLSNTTTYYVENEVTTTGITAHVGPASNAIGSGAYQTTTQTNPWYLQFDAVTDITLQTVKVYSSTTGNRTFLLQDRGSTQLKSLTVNIPVTGANVITLNWFIPAGEGYKLLVSGTPNLYYNTSGVSYPYLASGICKITGSFSGHTNYPFFYDLVVKSPDLVAMSGRQPVTATVTNTISVNASATLSTICNGQSTTLSATGASSYVWNPGQFSGSSITVNPSSTTTYTVTGTTSGCSGTSTVTITVNQNPVVSVTPSASICNGASKTLSASGATSYIWSNGATASSITVSPSSTTTYLVTGTTSGCTGSASSTVTVNPNPSVSTSSTAVSCFGGNNGSASAIASGGTPGYGYAWNTVPVQNTANATTLPAGLYTVTVTDANGCTVTQSEAVSQPAQLMASGIVTNTSCAGNNGAIDLTVTGGSGPYNYTWSPVGSTSQDLNSIAAGQYSVLVTDAHGCTSNQSFTVGSSSGAPASPGTVTGNTYVCKSSSGIAYSIAPVSGATNYAWTVPSGATIASGQGSTGLMVNFSSTQTSGNICVAASNGCGSSTPTCKSLTVVTAKPGVPTSITGSSINCAGTSGSFSCPPVTNAQFYTWTLPANATLTTGSGTNSVVISFASGFTGGYLRVAAGNCIGTSAQRTITLYGKPVTPGAISGPINGVCPNTNGVAYTVPVTPGATSYNWTPPANATIATGQGTNSVTVNYGAAFTSGNLSVTAVNTCGNSPLRSTTIRSVPLTPGAVTGATFACANQSGVSYAIAAVAGATSYTWTAPSNATIATGQGTTSVTVNYGSSFVSGTLKVTANNLCGSGPARSMTIKSLPSTPGNITGSSTVCANQSGVGYSIAAVAGATSYLWTAPAGATIASGQGTNAIVVNYGASGGNISVRAVNACGQSTPKTLAVSISCREAGNAGACNIFPNPAHERLNISFSADEKSSYVISIRDVTGRMAYISKSMAKKGVNTYELSVAEFSKGIYLVTFELQDERIVKRIVIE